MWLEQTTSCFYDFTAWQSQSREPASFLPEIKKHGTCSIHCRTDSSSNTKKNKKVLLRERKRYTDRGVSSTTRDGGWGVPPGQVWQVGTLGGVPPRVRVPSPSQVWWGIPKVGYQLSRHPPPPPAGPGRGTPPGVDRQNHRRTDTCQNITFPRTTYVDGNDFTIFTQ